MPPRAKNARRIFLSPRPFDRVNPSAPVANRTLNDNARPFLSRAGWNEAAWEFLTGDASARHYFRLHRNHQTAIVMDAAQLPDTIAPFIQINEHLARLGFSVPGIL